MTTPYEGSMEGGFTAQTTLTADAPLILDATCSFTRIWPRSASIRMDIRRAVKPDICTSATHLPFRDGVFREIYCDPPHLVRSSAWHGEQPTMKQLTGTYRPRYVRFRQHREFDMQVRYGCWSSREEWLSFVDGSGPEFRRVLSDGGLLFYKITDEPNGKVKAADVLERMPFDLAARKETVSKSHLANKNPVHWLTLKPRTSEQAGATTT